LGDALTKRTKRYTSKKDLATIFLRQNGKCAGLPGQDPPCRIRLVKGNHHIDHVIPVTPIMGGTDTVKNKQALCIECHAKKTRGTGATTAGTDTGYIKKMRKRLKGPQVSDHPVPGSRNTAFRVRLTSKGRKVERRKRA
jgi:5-methylcytosine-specific restriction endonuclease McrA